MISKDITLDENNNMILSGGDIAILQSDDQNIEAILKAEKGQFYEFPLLGYGVTTRINGPFSINIERKKIREELRRDNYNITQLLINEGPEIFIDAEKIK
jgi:hypothetical protein